MNRTPSPDPLMETSPIQRPLCPRHPTRAEATLAAASLNSPGAAVTFGTYPARNARLRQLVQIMARYSLAGFALSFPPLALFQIARALLTWWPA